MNDMELQTKLKQVRKYMTIKQIEEQSGVDRQVIMRAISGKTPLSRMHYVPASKLIEFLQKQK